MAKLGLGPARPVCCPALAGTHQLPGLACLGAAAPDPPSPQPCRREASVSAPKGGRTRSWARARSPAHAVPRAAVCCFSYLLTLASLCPSSFQLKLGPSVVHRQPSHSLPQPHMFSFKSVSVCFVCFRLRDAHIPLDLRSSPEAEVSQPGRSVPTLAAPTDQEHCSTG